MAEKDLRKKLKDYGLNTQGDKKSLISRLQRCLFCAINYGKKDNLRYLPERTKF